MVVAMVLALFPSGRVPCSGLPRTQCLGAPERCAWNGDACKEHAPRPERPMRALEHEMITCKSIDKKSQCKDDYEDCDWDKDDKTCSTVCAAVDGKSRCERAPRCVWEAWDGDEEVADGFGDNSFSSSFVGGKCHDGPPDPPSPPAAPPSAPPSTPPSDPPSASPAPPPWCLDGELPGSWDDSTGTGVGPGYGFACKDWGGDYNDNNVPDCDEQPYQHQEGDPVEYTVEDMRQIRAACPVTCGSCIPWTYFPSAPPSTPPAPPPSTPPSSPPSTPPAPPPPGCEGITKPSECQATEDCAWDEGEKTCATVCGAVDEEGRCDNAPYCVWERLSGEGAQCAPGCAECDGPGIYDCKVCSDSSIEPTDEDDDGYGYCLPPCICKEQWNQVGIGTQADPTACGALQYGCEANACDGDDPWCKVENKGCAEEVHAGGDGWAYCTPGEPNGFGDYSFASFGFGGKCLPVGPSAPPSTPPPLPKAPPSAPPSLPPSTPPSAPPPACEALDGRKSKCKDRMDCDWDKTSETCSTRCESVGEESTCIATPICVWESRAPADDLSGEEACEGKGLAEAECLAVGCCSFDAAQTHEPCFSRVGNAPCTREPAEDSQPADR